jgi:uncharacterized membrane protein YhaH (DUF805 family)
MRGLFIITLLIFSGVCFSQSPQQNAENIERNTNLIEILIWGIAGMGVAVGALAIYIKTLHSKSLRATASFVETISKATSTNEKLSNSFIAANEKMSNALDKNTSAIFDLHKLILERITK